MSTSTMSTFAMQAETKIQALNLAAQAASNVYSQSILSLAVSIIGGVRESKDNTEERLRILESIYDTSIACAHVLTMIANPNQSKSGMLTIDLINSLEKIRAIIERSNSRGKLRQMLSRSTDASSLKAAMDELDHRVRLFELRIHMSNSNAAQYLSGEANSKALAKLQETMRKTQAEQLSYIQAKVRSRIHDTMAEISSLPSKPQVFLGRDSEVEQVVDRLTATRQSFVAILGPGGIGKTSLLVAAMHHTQTIATFGPYRFYLPCDALKDAARLIAAIASLFKIDGARPLVQLKKMIEAFGQRISLTLDNFETPWEALAGRVAVEDVLVQLASITPLSLAVTLRGAERPGQISWTRPFIPPLRPLDHASAREVFLVISDTDPCVEIDELITSVDYVPLAVTLMASLAQFTPCGMLQSNWKQHKTSMLTRGIAGRLSNVDMSIELSLSSQRLQSQPRAIELLQILAVLPDGVVLSEISQVTPSSLINVEVSLLPALLQVSLAYHNAHDNKIRVLAPVREYIHSHHSISLEDLSHLLRHYSSLVEKAYMSRGSRDSQPVAETLIPQFGNIYSIITLSLPEPALAASAVQAVIHCVAFPPFAFAEQPLIIILQHALQVSESLQLLKLQVDCSLWLYDYKWKLFRGTDAQKEELLDRTAVLCSALGDKKRDILLLVRYAQAHTGAGSYLRACHILQEARSLCTAATSLWLRLKVLSEYGLRSQIQGHFEDSVAACNEGLLLLQVDRESRHASFKAQLYGVRAHCSMRRSLFSIASADFGLCMENSPSSWGREGNMGDYADALYMQSSLRSAEEAYQTALAARASFGMRDHVASYRVYLADIALLQGRAEEASNLYYISLSTFRELEMQMDVVRPVIGFGDIELQRDRPDCAFQLYIQAETFYRQLGLATNPFYLGCVLRLGDAELKTRHHDPALCYYVTACAWSCRMSNRLGVAQGLQRIGDLCFIMATFQSISDANSCYEVTLDFIRFLGANRHIADCLYRLGMVCLWRGDVVVGRKRFSQAKRFYVEAESPEGEALCEERLLDCDLSRDEILANFPSMPMANLLIY